MNQIIPSELALWKSAGFAHALLDVRTLVGGITGWQQAGLPVRPHGGAGRSS